MPGLSQDRPCILGLLKYSDTVGLDNILFMCPGMLHLYMPGLSQDHPCILGLLRYSDAAGLDDIYSYFMYIVHIYTPGMVPGILGYSLGGWRLLIMYPRMILGSLAYPRSHNRICIKSHPCLLLCSNT